MKRKVIAAALATLIVFGTTPSVLARHLAEEYADRVQRERRERMEEEAAAARRQAQAEARRQADEERKRRMEENERWAAAADEDDEEELDEEAVRLGQPAQEYGKERADEDQAVTRAEQGEVEAREKERLLAEERAREEAERQRQKEEALRSDSEEQAVREQERKAKEKESGTMEEANPTGESFLQQLLRRARERTQGIGSNSAEKPTLHVAKPQPMKILNAEHVDTGGTLIFSDSPEYVKQTGILYTDTIKGDARVFYYHLNDMGKKCKIAVVLESVGGQYAVVRVTRRAVATPSENYFEVGKGLQQAYFSDEHGVEKTYIASGERHLLLEEMDKTIVPSGYLASGMIDFTASAPVRVSVLCYPVEKDPLKYIDEATILPVDEYKLRGTFVGMERIVRLDRYDPEEDGVACVVFADGEHDKYSEGIDATDGSLATNYGNYGIVYRVEASTRGKAKFLMSPMGGGFAGALRVEESTSRNRLVNIPDGRLYFGQDSVHPPFSKDGMTTLLPSVDLSEIGAYRAKPPIFFEFSPPGASNLPVLLILVPENLKLEETGKGNTR